MKSPYGNESYGYDAKSQMKPPHPSGYSPFSSMLNPESGEKKKSHDISQYIKSTDRADFLGSLEGQRLQGQVGRWREAEGLDEASSGRWRDQEGAETPGYYEKRVATGIEQMRRKRQHEGIMSDQISQDPMASALFEYNKSRGLEGQDRFKYQNPWTVSRWMKEQEMDTSDWGYDDWSSHTDKRQVQRQKYKDDLWGKGSPYADPLAAQKGSKFQVPSHLWGSSDESGRGTNDWSMMFQKAMRF